MKRGVAANRPELIKFLEECSAVMSIKAHEDVSEWVGFEFDPALQPAPETVPEGVYFDPAAAPF